MNQGFDGFARQVMSGSRRGAAAGVLRAGLSLAEPFYLAGVSIRNRLYDLGISKTTRLDRPVIAVGNLTAGGTGKTPMVRWIAEHLRDLGRHVAIIARGYKSKRGQLGDEQRMLDRLLNGGGKDPVHLAANPNRVEAARKLLSGHSEVDVLVLDDAFQHRAVERDLNIVLLNASEPFGHDHLLPRGLLREPISSLRRADGVVLTHSNEVTSDRLSEIEERIADLDSSIPVYRAVHAPIGLRSSRVSSSEPATIQLEELRGLPIFAFCGLASPDHFLRQLESLGAKVVGHRSFGDHHAYLPQDVSSLRDQARAANAQALITTEKDWIKLHELHGAAETDPPVWRLDVQMQFMRDDQERLTAQIESMLSHARKKRLHGVE